VSNGRGPIQYLKKKKAELAALGEWTHINCLRPTARDDIHDDILRKLVYVPETDSNNDRATAPQPSRLHSLLSAIDIDNISSMDTDLPIISVRDTPGGTISFLFERGSKTALDTEPCNSEGEE
jgi:DNA repair and recombination protein RAD54B